MTEAISDQAVIKARDQWIRAVEAKDVDGVVELYAEDGILLGTVDTKETGPRKGRERIRNYFNHFLANDEVRAQFPEDNQAEIRILDNIAFYSGYYTFRLTNNGQTKVANAKFTYVYREQEGQLQILLHNSGLTPEGMTEA